MIQKQLNSLQKQQENDNNNINIDHVLINYMLLVQFVHQMLLQMLYSQ